MKPEPLGSISAYVSPLDEDLAHRLDELWGRYPALTGFAVRGPEALPEPLRAAVLENALVVAEVGVDPLCGSEYSEKVSDEIAVALLEFVRDRPEAADLLRDRTFARAMH
ncbi:MAG: hypothetical protein ACM30H_09990 [Clostridia bacterium]